MKQNKYRWIKMFLYSKLNTSKQDIEMQIIKLTIFISIPKMTGQIAKNISGGVG